MKASFLVLPASAAAIAFILAASGCSSKESGPPDPGSVGASFIAPSPFVIPEQYASLIGEYRRTWTNLSGFQQSGLHWGQYISIYVNQEPNRYIENFMEYVRVYLNSDDDEEEEESGPTHFNNYSLGTIFLKENYLPENGKPGKPVSLTIMIKRAEGFDPATHDWEFIQSDTTGRILFSGNSQDKVTQQVCIKCHSNVAERDFIFSTFCSLVSSKKGDSVASEAPKPSQPH